MTKFVLHDVKGLTLRTSILIIHWAPPIESFSGKIEGYSSSHCPVAPTEQFFTSKTSGQRLSSDRVASCTKILIMPSFLGFFDVFRYYMQE